MHKTILHRGAYGSQVHHATRDWADGGNTNVDELGLACGADNRMVGPDGWTTQINERHEVEWIPPPHLDTGQARVNFYHQPERLLRPPDDPECKSDNDFREPIGEPESFHPTADDDANGPGGPSPPDNQAA
ncbi:MAG: hypothetical protein QOK02_2971 [Mycobacterium sp.]|nr:hypothetical protein [Mycobacterium sp.]